MGALTRQDPPECKQQYTTTCTPAKPSCRSVDQRSSTTSEILDGRMHLSVSIVKFAFCISHCTIEESIPKMIFGTGSMDLFLAGKPKLPSNCNVATTGRHALDRPLNT